MLRINLLTLFLLFPLFSIQIEIEKPIYKGNTVSTDSGGIVTDENFRIQAKNIEYTCSENTINYLKASENILLQIDDKIYLANKIEYDFIKQEGQIHELKTQKGELYHGAKLTKIKNKAIVFDDAYAYTSEDEKKSAKIQAKTATLTNAKDLHTENISAKINDKTLLNLPQSDLNLKSEKKTLAYKLSFDNKSGPLILANYPILKSESLNINGKIEYKPKPLWDPNAKETFANVYSKTTFNNPENLFELEQNTILIPKVNSELNNLRLGARVHTKITHGDKSKLYYTLSLDKLSNKNLLSTYSSSNTFKKPLQKSAFNLYSNTKNYHSHFSLSKRINSFEMTREILPSFQALSHNIALGKGVYFLHDLKLEQSNFVYPKNFNPFLENSRNSTLSSKQTFFKPVNNHYFSFIPQISTFAKYNNIDNSALGFLNLKTELNTKFQATPYWHRPSYTNYQRNPLDGISSFFTGIFTKHKLIEYKFYTVFETTVTSLKKNISASEIVQSEQNFVAPNLKLGINSLIYSDNQNLKENSDLFFFIFKDINNDFRLSDIFVNYQLQTDKSSVKIGLQIDGSKPFIEDTFNSFNTVLNYNAASIGYNYAFSKTHAFSWDLNYFGPTAFIKNQYNNFKMETIYDVQTLKNSPLEHPMTTSTLKYQFSPYPLYNCKLKANLYANRKGEVASSIGADFSTTIYTIYEFTTNVSYNKKGFNFSFAVDLLR